MIEAKHEVSSIELNGVSALQFKKKQCLAKQQTSKTLLTKSHEHSLLWRITSPFIFFIRFTSLCERKVSLQEENPAFRRAESE